MFLPERMRLTDIGNGKKNRRRDAEGPQGRECVIVVVLPSVIESDHTGLVRESKPISCELTELLCCNGREVFRDKFDLAFKGVDLNQNAAIREALRD